MQAVITAEEVVRSYLASFGRDPETRFNEVLIGGRWISVETFASWIDRGVAGALPRAVRWEPSQDAPGA